MLTPGKILKYYRIKKNFTLDDVSSATKIPLEQLGKVEADSFDNTDSEVFYKGFIKNYSDFLNLDTEKILAIFRRTIATKLSQETINTGTTDKKTITIEKVNNSEIVKKSAPTKINFKELKDPKAVFKKIKTKLKELFKNTSITPSFIASVVAVIVVLAVVSYLIIQFNNYKKDPQIEITSPADQSITQESFLEAEGITDPKNILFINDELINLDSEGKFSYEVQLSEGTNNIDFVVKRNESDDGIKITRTVVYEKPFVPVEEPVTEIPEEEPIVITDHTLSLEMTEDVWIKLTIGDQKAINALLKAGEKKDYTWQDSFTISIGKPKTTKVIVDGEEKEIVVNMQTGVGRVSCTLTNSVVSCN